MTMTKQQNILHTSETDYFHKNLNQNIVSHKLCKKFSKWPKWQFTCMTTKICAKLLCCNHYFGQITKIFNHFVFQSFIIEALLKIPTTYNQEKSLRMDYMMVYYNDYLILNIVMYFRKIP